MGIVTLEMMINFFLLFIKMSQYSIAFEKGGLVQTMLASSLRILRESSESKLPV